jgi:hypothetical protein
MQRLARLAVLLLTVPLGAAQVSVSSSQLELFADTSGFFTLAQTPAGSALLYYDPVNFPNLGTTHTVFNLDGSAVDLQSANPVLIPVTASGSGLGANITMAKHLGAAGGGLDYGSTWTIVSDPHTGAGSGFIQIYNWVTNHKTTPAQVGLRLELDVELIDSSHDDAPLSIDNGLTTYSANTLLQAIADPIPSDWWTFDQLPASTFSAQGVTWGNGFGLPATQPDAVEFTHWDEVSNTGQYTPSNQVGTPFSSYARQDTAVVLWYTNSGQASGNNYTVQPGQTLAWVTYYGLNSTTPGATPTTYVTYTPTPSASPTPTISPTHTISPTWTVSPTISPTWSITQTYTVSPTFSVSPTQSQTFTSSPTSTITASFSASPTPTPTPSITASFSASPTVTATPSFSASPSVSPTRTASPTPSITRTATISPTHTVSPTVTETPLPDLILSPKDPNPNPSNGSGTWIPYVLSRDAEVNIRVYTVAGETVRDLDPFDASQGANEEFWDERNHAGARVASGIFIGRIVARAAGQEREAWIKMAVAR